MKFIISLTVAALAVTSSFVATAQNYPSQPLKITVPLGPGSGLDTNARFIAERLAKELGQPVIVQNRPGGNTVIGTQAVLAAPPDGYSILVISPSPVVINPVLRTDLPYEASKDITPVYGMNQASGVIIASASRFKSFKDMLDAAQKSPKSVSLGVYSDNYRLAANSFEQIAGVTFNQIPYNSPSAVMTDLMGGTIDIAFMAAGAALPALATGKAIALVVTGKARIDDRLLRDTPTMSEVGYPNYDFFIWTGFAVSSQVPAPIVSVIEASLAKVVGGQEFRDFLSSQGGETPYQASSAELKKMIASEQNRYRDVVARLE